MEGSQYLNVGLGNVPLCIPIKKRPIGNILAKNSVKKVTITYQMSKGTHEPREVLFLPLKISTAVGLLKYNGKPHEGVEVSLNVRKIDFSATK